MLIWSSFFGSLIDLFPDQVSPATPVVMNPQCSLITCASSGYSQSVDAKLIRPLSWREVLKRNFNSPLPGQSRTNLWLKLKKKKKRFLCFVFSQNEVGSCTHIDYHNIVYLISCLQDVRATLLLASFVIWIDNATLSTAGIFCLK